MIFRLSGALLRFADYNRSIDVPAATLDEALRLLVSRHQRLGSVLYDNTGRVRRSHRVLVNGVHLCDPSQKIPLTDTDEVELLTPITGG